MANILNKLKAWFFKAASPKPIDSLHTPPPKMSARTKAGLLGAHISHAGRFTEDGDMGAGAYISLIAAACAAILLGLLAAWVWGTFQ